MRFQSFFLKSVLATVFLFTFFQVLFGSYGTPSSVSAATKSLTQIDMFEGIGTGGGVSDPRKIIHNIINVAMGFLGMIAVIVILYAGFKWMTAGGQKEQIEKAQKLLTNGVIGLVLIFSAWTISLFLLYALKKTVKEVV